LGFFRNITRIIPGHIKESIYVSCDSQLVSKEGIVPVCTKKRKEQAGKTAIAL
jgi:hypothetical protein